jgi:hypothetical protein
MLVSDPRVSRVLFCARHHVLSSRVARADRAHHCALSRACSRVILALFARRRHSFARSCRASDSRVARISRVDHVCRVTFARENKVFSRISTQVNNVSLSGHIF